MLNCPINKSPVLGRHIPLGMINVTILGFIFIPTSWLQSPIYFWLVNYEYVIINYHNKLPASCPFVESCQEDITLRCFYLSFTWSKIKFPFHSHFPSAVEMESGDILPPPPFLDTHNEIRCRNKFRATFHWVFLTGIVRREMSKCLQLVFSDISSSICETKVDHGVKLVMGSDNSRNLLAEFFSMTI